MGTVGQKSPLVEASQSAAKRSCRHCELRVPVASVLGTRLRHSALLLIDGDSNARVIWGSHIVRSNKALVDLARQGVRKDLDAGHPKRTPTVREQGVSNMVTLLRLRSPLVIALLATGAAAADSTSVSGTAEPSSTPPPPPMIINPEPLTGTVGVAYSFLFMASNGAPPLTWSEKTPTGGTLTMGLSLASYGGLSGTPNIDGQFPITLKVTDALGRSASVPTTVRVSLARPPSAFTKTGSLGIPRSGHAATLLLTKDVLVTGGGNGLADMTAELYDPNTGTFSATKGPMIDARSGHTATLLSNANLPNHGKVLIVGSMGTSAELYDPVKSAFAATGSMHHARTSPTATLLNTGKVLVVGGDPSTTDLRAELYDPTSGTFFYTGSTTTPRSGHTATKLIGGNVLIAGGIGAAGPTAEVYNPSSGTFTRTTHNMNVPRTGHTATLLGTEDGSQDGSVLIIGTDGSADLYNPNTETFTRVGSTLLGRPNYNHTASLINDQGAVLVAGGYTVVPWCGTNNRFQFSIPGAELFASESDGFTITGGLNMSQDDLTMSRDGHTATVLADGITVLIVGGTQRSPTNNCIESTNILSSAELFKTGQQQTTFTLTGFCVGIHAHNSAECETSTDVAQCPVGQAAIRPVNALFTCGVRPVQESADAALYCGASFNTFPGICQTRVKTTP